MTSPSDMAKAREIAGDWTVSVPEQEQLATSIAAALYEAREQGRREGLKRAAEIAENDDQFPAEGLAIAHAILFEIGEGA